MLQFYDVYILTTKLLFNTVIYISHKHQVGIALETIAHILLDDVCEFSLSREINKMLGNKLFILNINA